MYSQGQGPQAGPGEEPSGQSGGTEKPVEGEVVDAEFEEVKNKK
jgi:molecular chaperone DnaK